MHSVLALVKTRAITVRREGDRVLTLEDGRVLLDMPYDAALRHAQALVAQARLIEEERKADAVAFDQAILMRSGFRLGLTNNRAIQQMAGNLAAWDTKLRRYLPGGIRSQEVVGTPAVILHPPREKPHGQAEND